MARQVQELAVWRARGGSLEATLRGLEHHLELLQEALVALESSALFSLASSVEVSSGAITLSAEPGPVRHVVTVDTGGPAEVDLSTISGVEDGSFVELAIANSARKVRLTEAGNLSLGGPIPQFLLTAPTDRALLSAQGGTLHAVSLKTN